MDFSTAVLNAKNGDVDSFEYLHKSTSVDMYYLVLKYVIHISNLQQSMNYDILNS